MYYVSYEEMFHVGPPNTANHVIQLQNSFQGVCGMYVQGTGCSPSSRKLMPRKHLGQNLESNQIADCLICIVSFRNS